MKVARAIEKYGIHCVVGNVLDTRYLQVSLTTRTQNLVIRRTDEHNIESPLVEEIVRLHSKYFNDMAIEGDIVEKV